MNAGWKLHLLALLIFFVYLALVILSQSKYSTELTPFFALMALAYALVFGLFAYLWQQKKALSARYVFGWACLYHLLGLFGWPLFEDDYYRYLWDAYHTVQYGSPYGVAPSEYFDTEGLGASVPALFQGVLNGINYPDIPTIYGPVLQYSFLLAYLISPGEVWALQLVYSLVDLVLIAVLLKLAAPRMVLLYAWSPLVFKELVLTAHPDGIGVCLLMVAVLSFYHKAYYYMALALAASVAAKVFAILFVPFLLFKTNLRVVGLFIFSLVALYFPLLSDSAGDLLGLNAMAQSWQFNSALYGLLTMLFTAQTSKLILALVLFLGFGWYFYRYHFGLNLLKAKGHIRGDIMMGGFLLCAPVINPWYLIWVLPFAVIHKNVSAWLASVMVMMAYIIGLNLEGSDLSAYQQPVWARVVEFGVIFACVMTEWLTSRNAARYTEKGFLD